MSAPAELKAFNTLAVKCRAAELEFVTSVEQLKELSGRRDPRTLLILGEGSNVVLAPELARTVVLMRIRGISADQRGDDVEVTVAAGENWHQLVMWSVTAGFCGLENLALIPGSAGAAPVQNIGAYGVELADLLVSVEALDLSSGNLLTLSREDCCFGYRDSLFKQERGRYAITRLTLRLRRDQQPTLNYPDLLAELENRSITSPGIADVANAVISIRQAKLPDPAKVANVGSFFKNPLVTEQHLKLLMKSHPTLKSFPVSEPDDGVEYHKLSAAQLIDLAGFKQRGTELVGVWPKQPLVIVNHAAPTAMPILEFADRIQREVERRFQIQLEIEPDLIGFN